MTMKEVCRQFGIAADTLRYYERVGVIPPVARTKGGQRDYSNEDIKWVQNAICMRGAGLSIEMLAEYVRLFRQGDQTIPARHSLLSEAREEVENRLKKDQETLDKLNYKLSRYEAAMETGVLTWDCSEP